MVVSRPSIEKIIGLNKNCYFLLPEAACCCLQSCNLYMTKLVTGYMSIPSFIIIGTCIYELHHINCLYHNVWPKANFCNLLLFTSKQNCLQKIVCSCTTCHGFQSSCEVSPLYHCLKRTRLRGRAVFFLRARMRVWQVGGESSEK